MAYLYRLGPQVQSDSIKNSLSLKNLQFVKGFGLLGLIYPKVDAVSKLQGV